MSNVDTGVGQQVVASHFVTSFSLSTVNRNEAWYEIHVGVKNQQMADSKLFFPKRFSSHSSHVDIQPVADFAFVLSLLFFSSMSMTLMAASGILVPGGGKNNLINFFTSTTTTIARTCQWRHYFTKTF